MRKIVLGYAIIMVLCCCPVLIAEEKDEGDSKTIPAHLLGVWIERGEDSKELGRITVSDKRIIWERSGADTEKINAQDVLYSEDTRKLTFSSGVVVAQGVAVPSDKLSGKASVILFTDQDDLVVEISGIKEKVKRCGALPAKGCVGVTREIVEGEMLVCIEHPPEVHRYKKYK